MRKVLLNIALCVICAVIPVSCIVDSSSSGPDAEDYTRDESFNMFYESLESPLRSLGDMLLCSEYCFADPEERKDPRFNPLREDLYIGDGGKVRYLYQDILLGDLPLHRKGGTLKLYHWSYFKNEEEGWLEFECLEDSTSWSVKFEDSYTTVFTKDDGIIWKAATSGQCRSRDGYDLAFGTVGDFSMTMEYGYVSKIVGVFRHTVSKDGKVWDVCTRNYTGDTNCSVTVERVN